MDNSQKDSYHALFEQSQKLKFLYHGSFTYEGNMIMSTNRFPAWKTSPSLYNCDPQRVDAGERLESLHEQGETFTLEVRKNEAEEMDSR
jgi:hypothetical protein